MKKRSLAIVISTFLTISASFAADSTNQGATAQIFTHSFDVSVKKQSAIKIDPPKKEMIHLDEEKLSVGFDNAESIDIGSMDIEATAKTCYATIKTENNFKLKGEEYGEVLAYYGLHYRTQGKTMTKPSTMSEAKFASNMDGEMPVNCDTADLAMMVYKYNQKAPADIYNDVVIVEVRAES